MQPPGRPPARRLRTVRPPSAPEAPEAPAAPEAPEAPWWASEHRVTDPARPVEPARPSSGRTEAAARRLYAELAHDVVDHTLRRRAVLTAVATGRTTPWEPCDAHPHLVTAARHHGVPTGRSCPICKRPGVHDVHFVYGEALKHVAGQAKTPLEVHRLATGNGHAARRFDVYVVEVCTHCRWNHLLRSFAVEAGVTGPRGYGSAASGG